MKTIGLIFILYTLNSCNTIKSNTELNPYYNLDVTPYLYYGIGNLNVQIIHPNSISADGNTFKLNLPDSISRNNMKGEATYDITINRDLKVTKIQMTSLILVDSLENILTKYYRFNKFEKYCIEPSTAELKFDPFFKENITLFQFQPVSTLDDENIVGCKFIF